MAKYIGLIRKDKNIDYGVDFPDFLGCVPGGKTLIEAKKMAKEALDFHIEGMDEDKEAFYKPTSFEKIAAEAEDDFLAASLVAVSLPYPPTKVTYP